MPEVLPRAFLRLQGNGRRKEETYSCQIFVFPLIIYYCLNDNCYFCNHHPRCTTRIYMRANNPIAPLREMPKGVLAIIAACAAICIIKLIWVGGAQFMGDSTTYIDAWEDVSHLDINIFRTPVYPLFIGVCKGVFGEALMLDAVVVAQIIIFLISIGYFYKSAMMVASSKIISLCATFTYAFFPTCFLFNVIILTESLSISGMVFLVYLTLKAMESPSLKYPAWMCLVMLFLLFLRPSFLFLIPIYIIGWSILFVTRKSQRKLYGKGLIGIAVVTLALVSYACAFKAKYGVFGTSQVSIINNYYICRQNTILEANATNNPKLKETIEKFYILHGNERIEGGLEERIWQEIDTLFYSRNYPLADLNELVGRSMAMHKTTIAKSIVVRLWDSRLIILAGPLSMFVCLCFVGIAFFCILYVAVKRKSLPLVSTYLLSCFVGLYLVSVIGAQAEWGRLTFPVLPCWLLLAAQFASLLQCNPQRRLT